MDDRRFDSIAKALAAGTSRRSVFKGLLGLGGVAVVGSALREGEVEAQRRPTPTPKPPTCPGQQTPQGGQCVCLSPPAPGTEKCGPDCCNNTAPNPSPNYSECCDNACCYGNCYGEELCCDYPLVFCEAQNECCFADDNQCCGSTGCCDTPCCPIANGTNVCCEGATPKCCGGDKCIPSTGCCTDDECPGCQTCQNNICADDNDECAGCLDCANAICVTNNANCNDGNACTQDICGTNGVCTNPFFCTGNSCCDDGNACTQNICNTQTGQCSYPPFCTSNACCDDGNACTQNICNTGTGVCDYPFFCTSDACCSGNPAGPACNLDNGQCFTPCADLGEPCAGIGCCSSAEVCYSILEGELSVCGPCIPTGAPCGIACDFCCAEYSFLGFCSGSCGIIGNSCQDNPDGCCDGFCCQFNPIGDNFCSVLCIG